MGGVSNSDMREIAQKSGLETPPTIGIILKWTSTVAILTPLNWKNRQLNASGGWCVLRIMSESRIAQISRIMGSG